MSIKQARAVSTLFRGPTEVSLCEQIAGHHLTGYRCLPLSWSSRLLQSAEKDQCLLGIFIPIQQ